MQIGNKTKAAQIKIEAVTFSFLLLLIFKVNKPPMDRIRYVVTNGIGVMQAWEGILTDEEIEAVAYYIFNSTNK